MDIAIALRMVAGGKVDRKKLRGIVITQIDENTSVIAGENGQVVFRINPNLPADYYEFFHRGDAEYQK